MKKLSIILLATVAMISCGNSYEGKTVRLTDQNDSLNYALGLVNGAQIKQYYLSQDSTKETVNEFMDALVKAYEGKQEKPSRVEETGRNIGSFARECETKGLAENEAWAINEKIFFQGLINGIKNDTTIMTGAAARDYFQEQYYAAADSDEKAANSDIVRAKCGEKVAQIELKNSLDSINYAFGYLNGEGIGQNLLAEDSTGNDFKVLVKAINTGLKQKVKNPQLVQMATQIGNAIREQEKDGLLGMEQVSTNFDLMKQGFVNGLVGYDKEMTMQEAGEYLDSTISNIKFGKVKQEGEAFLAENALREEVTVLPSGLQYEVLKEGKGPRPTKEDKVRVHYHGTLIDGTVFDSSVDRGESITFGVTQVIAGWTEALQLMPVGSKWKLYIPQELAYGDRSAGQIPPYSALIFEVELLGIEK